MSTLESTDDLLRAARENREFREAFRREILTEELMAAPGDIRELKEITANIAATCEALNVHAGTTNQQLENVADGIKSLQQVTEANARGIGDLVGGIADMNRNLGEKIDGVEERLTQRIDGMGEQIDGLGEQIDGLGEKVDTELTAQSAFRGTYAQSAANKERIRIANKFAYLHGVKYTDAMGVRRDVMRGWLRGENTAIVEGLQLRDRAWETFLVPDLVAAVHDLTAPEDARPLYYIALESSYSIDDEDVVRATDHAKIVNAVTGLPAYAVVAGVRLDERITDGARNRIREEVAEYVEAGNQDFVYWHKLEASESEAT